jgi:hypothetical protein
MTRDHLGLRALILPAVAAVALCLAPAAGAQPPRRPRPLENIKTLKGWNGDEVRAEMRLMSEALGVKCDYCHVQGNFASDEKRAKHTARRMLELTMALNAENFASHTSGEGQSKLGRVTCYTCHQGAQVPKQGAGPGAVAW